jgi:hypothetical protein
MTDYIVRYRKPRTAGDYLFAGVFPAVDLALSVRYCIENYGDDSIVSIEQYVHVVDDGRGVDD